MVKNGNIHAIRFYLNPMYYYNDFHLPEHIVCQLFIIRQDRERVGVIAGAGLLPPKDQPKFYFIHLTNSSLQQKAELLLFYEVL